MKNVIFIYCLSIWSVTLFAQGEAARTAAIRSLENLEKADAGEALRDRGNPMVERLEFAYTIFPAMIEVFNSSERSKLNNLQAILRENIDVPSLESKALHERDPLSSYRLALIREYNIFGDEKQFTEVEINELKKLYRTATEGNIAGAHYRLGRLELLESNSIEEFKTVALHYLYYDQEWSDLLFQLVKQARSEDIPVLFEKAKTGDSDAIYRVATHLNRYETKDKAIELFALCAEMGNADCMVAYGAIVDTDYSKIVDGEDSDFYNLKAALIYTQQYDANPHPILALKIGDSYNRLSTRESPEIRMLALQYYKLGAEGNIPRAVYMYQEYYKKVGHSNEEITELKAYLKDKQLINNLSLPDNIEDYEQYFLFGKIDIPGRFEPVSMVLTNPESVKEIIMSSDKPVVLFTYTLSTEEATRQLIRLSELTRICRQFGDDIRFITYVTYDRLTSGAEKVSSKIFYEELSSIVGLTGEHYFTRDGTQNFAILNPVVTPLLDRLLVYDKNKSKRALYLNSKTTVAQLEKIIRAKIK